MHYIFVIKISILIVIYGFSIAGAAKGGISAAFVVELLLQELKIYSLDKPINYFN